MKPGSIQRDIVRRTVTTYRVPLNYENHIQQFAKVKNCIQAIDLTFSMQ